MPSIKSLEIAAWIFFTVGILWFRRAFIKRQSEFYGDSRNALAAAGATGLTYCLFRLEQSTICMTIIACIGAIIMAYIDYRISAQTKQM